MSYESAFQNEPVTDFSDFENVEAMRDALEHVHAQLGQTTPLVIGNERITSFETFDSVNPANHREIVGKASCASKEQAAQAIGAAQSAFAAWRKTPIAERAEILKRVAAGLRERKFEFAAWLVYEVSKNWNEAHAEVAEAIDFCEYYARRMCEVESCDFLDDVTQVAGEHSALSYKPLGVGVILAPWNFPLAILGGTTLAPVVAGNTVVMKPSPRSPIIAYELFKVLEAAGLPHGVVNFVTGRDADIGDTLVDDPRVHFISFTGSKEVGMHIHERAARVLPGQKHFKRVILEMGGKGTIVVDETANLDAAADGIVVSAFGYQGQKCSACTRVVALSSIHDALLQKIVERAGQLLVRDPSLPNISLGAMIDERAYDKVCSYLNIGKKEGLLASGGVAQKDTGYFVWPTVFTGVSPDARVAQEEIFGPVLAVLKARDWREAMKIANNTDYGLTGGVYSQSEKRLQQASEEFQVGNLYVNRKITGALVGVHPFGGLKLSGDGSKAGGPDYLLNFLQSKTVVKRTA